MSVIVILIAASLSLALLFLGGFVWSVWNGQFEDTSTPSLRVLIDETPPLESGSARARSIHCHSKK